MFQCFRILYTGNYISICLSDHKVQWYVILLSVNVLYHFLLHLMLQPMLSFCKRIQILSFLQSFQIFVFSQMHVILLPHILKRVPEFVETFLFSKFLWTLDAVPCVLKVVNELLYCFVVLLLFKLGSEIRSQCNKLNVHRHKLFFIPYVED